MAANNRRAENAPNIYPLGHPLRAAGGQVQNKPTPQPARSRPTVLQTVPAATPAPTPASVPAAQAAPAAPAAPAPASGNTEASTANLDAQTTEA